MRKASSTLYRTIAGCLLAVALVAVGAVAADAATGKHRSKRHAKTHRTAPRTTASGSVGVALQGGSPQTLSQVCAADRTATVAPVGSSVSAQVSQQLATRTTRPRAKKRSARRGALVRATGPATMLVEICHDAQWQRVSSTSLGSSASSGAPLTTTLAATGDYRVTASASVAGRTFTSAPAYLRVGVGEIVDDPVSFPVANTNRTSVPLCAADGSNQLIKGRIVGPRAVLEGPAPKAATLYVHGIGYTQSFFHFKAVPGYDYATQMAQAGKVSFLVDRLGIGASGQPDGNAICIGTQADAMHQVIKRINGGAYQVAFGTPPQFQHVVIAGHSLGGLIAEYEAWTFQDVSGLIVMSYSDLGPSPLTLQQFGTAAAQCIGGGASSGAGSPHYADFGATDADFRAAHFYNVDPAVEQAVLAERPREPCGDITSVLGAIVQDSTSLPFKVPGPALLVFGQNDALFPPPAGTEAQFNFGTTPDVSLTELPQTGHSIALGRTAPALRATVLAWLNAHHL